jgi:hypothetical protein
MKKIWKSIPTSPKHIEAQYAYTGPLFSKTKAFAERFFPMRWYILSDKYGVIAPKTFISDYNTSPAEVKKDLNFLNLVKKQTLELKLTPHTIYTTCGKIHEDIIMATFPGVDIKNPVRGLSQGMRLQKLNKIIGV